MRNLLLDPDTILNRRVDSNRKVVESPSIIQLARDRLRKSFDETEGQTILRPIAAIHRLGPVIGLGCEDEPCPASAKIE